MLEALIGTIVAFSFSLIHDTGTVRALRADSATAYASFGPTSTSESTEKNTAFTTAATSASSELETARPVSSVAEKMITTDAPDPEYKHFDTDVQASETSGATDPNTPDAVSPIRRTAVPAQSAAIRVLQTVPPSLDTTETRVSSSPTPSSSSSVPSVIPATLHRAIQLGELNASTRAFDYATAKVEESVRAALVKKSQYDTPLAPEGPEQIEHEVKVVTQEIRAVVIERERPTPAESARPPHDTQRAGTQGESVSETATSTRSPQEDVAAKIRTREAHIVSDAVSEHVSSLSEVHDELVRRDGLALYTDTDKDGVSDYDEEHIYRTDPTNPHTIPGVLSDGEKILQGIDPLSVSAMPIPVQSPRTEGFVVNDLFEVEAIVATSVPVVAPTGVSHEAPVATTTAIAFSGRALPNSFVTLYIFSTPIVVTVKADSTGRWRYRLDKELPDGAHELYVAMVDNSGSIIAKSPAVPFTKRAEALEYTPLVLPPVSDADARQRLMVRLAMVGGVSALCMAAVIVIGIGMLRRPRTPAV